MKTWIQKLWNAAKAILRRKFIGDTANIRKEEKLETMLTLLP